MTAADAFPFVLYTVTALADAFARYVDLHVWEW
jgi:hypothetical protein